MLDDFGLLARIFTATNGVWTLVVLLVSATAVAWVRSRPSILERENERKRDAVSERSGDWERLRKEVSRLADRVEALERKVADCEAERDEAVRRAVRAESEVIRLEAYHQGTGESRQVAQMIVSTEREKGS